MQAIIVIDDDYSQEPPNDLVSCPAPSLFALEGAGHETTNDHHFGSGIFVYCWEVALASLRGCH